MFRRVPPWQDQLRDLKAHVSEYRALTVGLRKRLEAVERKLNGETP